MLHVSALSGFEVQLYDVTLAAAHLACESGAAADHVPSP